MWTPPYWSFPECNIPAPFILSFKDVMHEREIFKPMFEYQIGSEGETCTYHLH